MKKVAYNLSLVVVMGMLGAAFFMPKHAAAASPYTDEFENFNSEGWQIPAGGGSCGYHLPVATSSGYQGAGVEFDHVDCFGFNASNGFYHSGQFTAVGGFQIKVKEHNMGATNFVSLGFCYTTVPCSSVPPSLPVSIAGTAFSQDVWHTIDVTFVPVGTSTEQFYLFIDGAGETDGQIATTTPLNATGVVIAVSNVGSGQYALIDSLNNEFALQQQSVADVVNQSFYIATSTVQNVCNANYATSTGLFSDIANGISYGFCVTTSFLFVPNTTVVGQYGQLASLLPQKIPFSYYYDFSSILNGSSASSTGNFSVLSVDLRGTGVGSTTPWGSVLPTSFTYLASSTIATYVPQGLYDTLFLLMRSAIWIVVLFHIYHRLRPKQATHV